VITGLGSVCAAGHGWRELWKKLLAGSSSLSKITRFDASQFPCDVAGQVENFDIEDYVDYVIGKQTDRFTHFMISATSLALADSGLDLQEENLERVGCVCGNALGGVEFGERELYNLYRQGARHVSPYQAIAWFYAAGLGQISIKHKLKGICKVFVADRAGSAMALGYSFNAIRNNRADIIFCGGSEAPLAPYGLVGYHHSGLLSDTRQGEPWEAYRPFDCRRKGLVLGEGGAILVLEEREHARARGANIYAELAGFGATCDAVHHSEIDPEGVQNARAINIALEQAGMTAAEVGYINADGVGSVEGDLSEANAFRSAFNHLSENIPVSSPKSAIGNLFGGAAAMDMLINALVIKYGIIPPTVGLKEPDERIYLAHVIGEPLERDVDVALMNSRGRGGSNFSLVVVRAN